VYGKGGFCFLPRFDARWKRNCLDLTDPSSAGAANKKRSNTGSREFVDEARSRMQYVRHMITRMRKDIEILDGTLQTDSRERPESAAKTPEDTIARAIILDTECSPIPGAAEDLAMRSVGLVTAFYESGDRHIGSVAGSGDMAASLRGKTPGDNRSSRNFSDESSQKALI
jgi:hypothetical protein